MTLPAEMLSNAYTGTHAAAGAVAPDAKRWILRERIPPILKLLAPTPPDFTRWDDPQVGWGLVLPEPPNAVQLSPAQLGTAADAPEPLQQLVKDRNAPVFRYRAGPHAHTVLRNYAVGKDLDMHRSGFGVAAEALPYYLLLYGTPEEIPWSVQYVLNGSRAVGRLTLTGAALEHYVSALRDNWQHAASRAHHALLWCVDHGGGDITTLMRESIGEELLKAYRADNDMTTTYLAAATADRTALASNLKTNEPGLIITTSHGQTGPLHDTQLMRTNMGLLVDQQYALVTPTDLLAQWQPDGAIWYAHACCSAGSDAATNFGPLFTSGSTLRTVLDGIAACGSTIAPLPQALLGAKKPLRAFIGHVEPTFDYTLRQPGSGQNLTKSLAAALYTGLYLGHPVGHAFRSWYQPLASLSGSETEALRQFNTGADTVGDLLYYQLTSRDIRATVLIGDPTVRLPIA